MATSKGISSLHSVASGIGQPSSLRDASNSRPASEQSSNTRTPWKGPPTPIVPPTNRPPNYMHNPWSSERMKNTLNTHGGNLTKRSTVLQPQESKYFADTSASKKNKTSRASAPGNAHRATVNIDVSDEDIGEPLVRPAVPLQTDRNSPFETREPSPDPLDGLPRTSSAPGPSRRSSHPLSSTSKWTMPHDGPHTEELARRIERKKPRLSNEPITETRESGIIEILDDAEQHEVADSIEEFNDSDEPFVPPASTTLKGPSVKGIVEMFEVIERKPAKTTLPHIDFTRKSIAQGVANRMRPKGRPSLNFEPVQPPRLDPIATASSNFTTGTRSKTQARAKKDSPGFALPLEAWTKGLTMFDASGNDGKEYWFCFDGKEIQIRPSAEGSSPVFDFRPHEFIGSIMLSMASQDTTTPVLIKMYTSGSPRRFPHRNETSFKHGSSGEEGAIAFKFLTQHPNWANGETFQELSRLLQGLIPNKRMLDSHASRTSWELSQNAAAWPDVADSEDEAGNVKRSKPELEEPMPRQSPRTRPASTRNTANTLTQTVRNLRSTKKPIINSSRSSPAPDSDEIILVYPPSGTGGVNITGADLKRLDPGQYLNDTLIEFALKLWLSDIRERDPAFADQIHIFSSFFYKKIQVKDKEEGYASVRKWTSKFDLFKKKYLVVPINEHLHWYLAIICNPEFVLQPPPPQPERVVSAVQTRKRKRDSDFADLDTSKQESRAASQEPLPPDPQGAQIASPAASAEDEGTVEALLGTCSISPKGGNADDDIEVDLAMHEPPVPDTGELGELVWPEWSEPEFMVVDSASEDVTTIADPSMRSASEPAILSPVVDVDTSMDVDSHSEPDTTALHKPVPCSSFYGSSSRKGKERAVLMSPEIPYNDSRAEIKTADIPTVDNDNESEETSVPEPVDFSLDKTYIFTFDSLGTKHPAAIRNLSGYLQLEAKDKKSLDISQTTPATGSAALVPAQPNFCDCGVYLIHFVQRFMLDPIRMSEKIITKKPKDYDSKERELDWDAETVGGLRDVLRAKALSLSEEWKKEKAVREQQKKKETATSMTSSVTEGEVIPDSDDEIVVGEVISKPSTKRGAKGKQAAKNEKSDNAGALRLR